MNRQPSLASTHWQSVAVLAIAFVSSQAWAQAQPVPWDFAKLGEPVANPRAQVTLKGFAQKAQEVNDQIVTEDTVRTRQRDAQRLSSTPPPASQGEAALPSRADTAGSAARWICKLRCTDAGILNEKKGDWMSFEVSASSKLDAQNRGRELARRHCAVVRQEWGGTQCEKK